jgi:leucine-rich repeat protein SHOC2
MEEDVGILSLVGMGGIGKTTLATELYRNFEKNDTFEKKSLLLNVRESAIFDLQKQLARDLFREDVRSEQEFNKRFNRGMDRKVLIVIDDVHKRVILINSYLTSTNFVPVVESSSHRVIQTW